MSSLRTKDGGKNDQRNGDSDGNDDCPESGLQTLRGREWFGSAEVLIIFHLGSSLPQSRQLGKDQNLCIGIIIITSLKYICIMYMYVFGSLSSHWCSEIPMSAPCKYQKSDLRRQGKWPRRKSWQSWLIKISQIHCHKIYFGAVSNIKKKYTGQSR